mmetsp:Transcript_74132/g.143445  ORF Transcript_74132/g.143445 Transcript_74132/m.143445 type:complete len:502 (-) Transcript_74132:20-1525(-)|eukprot:CAMPEP_0172683644 /NCGR_PEP_ID=MMETSP1074-20121228/19004_1 /TAXON_ID=2916 /ORGANISM="Ceratium fusus, Strain PA161109" /LENGTH=501 /DNA_ID=CAMNT_0013502531 /DNA_START=80 /DNA_END=1585 /DNA_ORIENTATION=+
MPSSSCGHHYACMDKLLCPAATVTAVAAAGRAEKCPDLRMCQCRYRQHMLLYLKEHCTCQCMLRCSFSLLLLWFMLLLCASRLGIQSGMQMDCFSEMLGVATNIGTLKNETQTALASQASFTVDTERCLSGRCGENTKKSLHVATRPTRTMSLVQKDMLTSKTFFGREGHEVDEQDIGLPGIVNKTARRMPAEFQIKVRHLLVRAVDTVATSVDTGANLAHKRLGIYQWACLSLAICVLLVCFFTALSAMGLHAQRMEVHSAQAASAESRSHEGGTQLLKQKSAASCSLLTSPSGPPILSKQSLTPRNSSVPSQPASDDGQFLCPALVVPGSFECVLRVDLKPAPLTPAAVTDPHGNKLMCVTIQDGASSQTASPRDAHTVVLATMEGYVLAHCSGSQQGDGQYHLLRPDGQLFAKLWLSDSQLFGHLGAEHAVYTVRSTTGAEWYFGVSFSECTYDVTDSTGRLLAIARPEVGPFWQIRLAPRVDVSLVVIGLATISNLV